MDAPLPTVGVSRKGEERLRSGHLWVFGDDLRDLPRELPPGSWVRILSRAGEPLGTGTLNLASRIALRVVSRGVVSPGKAFFREAAREGVEEADRGGAGGRAPPSVCIYIRRGISSPA